MQFEVKNQGAVVRYYVGDSFESILKDSNGTEITDSLSLKLDTTQEILFVILG